ncbi:uncharacterized protein LOC109847499 [Asparagus officinalis]|uniref:uncharacterized protein LOC109847499 n=1 Tax=Asparagus officinalis TaxID=4686 RepID=UPI00098E7655|nr:uncharacterized protein LOC109847499 [Asparagus officinalis]
MVREISPNCALEYFPPSTDSKGMKYASIPRFEIMLNVEKWNSTLIGYVLGDKPFYSHLKGCVGRLWKLTCSLEIYSRENGFFFFKFGSNEEMNRVLNGGPWLFDGRLIILKKWTENSGLERELLSTVPVWIRFPSLHLKLWSNNIIGRIASLVGIPLYIDQATASGERLAYARCFVEISSKSKLPNSVRLDLGNGEWLETNVEYEWIPPKCNKCLIFGHVNYQCLVVLVEKWIPKESSIESDRSINPKQDGAQDITVPDENQDCVCPNENQDEISNKEEVSNSFSTGDTAMDEYFDGNDRQINKNFVIEEVLPHTDEIGFKVRKIDEINIDEDCSDTEIHLEKEKVTQYVLNQENQDNQHFKVLPDKSNCEDITKETADTLIPSMQNDTSYQSGNSRLNINNSENIDALLVGSDKEKESNIDFPISIDNPEWLSEKNQIHMKKKNQLKLMKELSSGPKRVTRASSNSNS